MATERELRSELVTKARNRIGETNATTAIAYNKIKKDKRGALSYNSPTCSAFMSCILDEAGDNKIGAIEAYIPWFINEAKSHGAIIVPKTDPVYAGDLCIFDWLNDSTRDHIAVVAEVNGGRIKTIEGNMSTTDKVGTRDFSQTWSQVEYYLRLDWSAIATKELDRLIVDGIFGKKSILRSQDYFNTYMDGIVSAQLKSSARYVPSVDTRYWKFVRYSRYGSDVVRAIQKLVGAIVDGKFGRDTAGCMQKFLIAKGFTVKYDKIMGPQTVKAWQAYLNTVM